MAVTNIDISPDTITANDSTIIILLNNILAALNAGGSNACCPETNTKLGAIIDTTTTAATHLEGIADAQTDIRSDVATTSLAVSALNEAMALTRDAAVKSSKEFQMDKLVFEYVTGVNTGAVLTAFNDLKTRLVGSSYRLHSVQNVQTTLWLLCYEVI